MKIRVEGEACLDYIDKPIGFVNKGTLASPSEYVNMALNFQQNPSDNADWINGFYDSFIRRGHGDVHEGCLISQWYDGLQICKFNHDKTKRKIGYVTKKYTDGGLRVHVFGDEEILFEPSFSKPKNIDRTSRALSLSVAVGYDYHLLEYPQLTKTNGYTFYALYEGNMASTNQARCQVNVGNWETLPFDSILDYEVNFDLPEISGSLGYNMFTTQGSWNLTDNLNTTIIFGQGVESSEPFYFNADQMDDPLKYCNGDYYYLLNTMNSMLYVLCPASIANQPTFDTYQQHTGVMIMDTNLVATPYNLILTDNYNYAQAYLNSGVLPPDAYLFPLDWENLPTIDVTPLSPDVPDDYDDNNIPDDDGRDFDPNLPETPTFTINQLTNYNWYWLTVPDWSNFLTWFWNDIGDYSSITDILAKIQGLYNDVASTILMCRYYPVEYDWITGIAIANAPTSNIKLGMIEKQGAVTCIDQTNPLRVREIGHIHISEKYKSFMDMSPYSQLSLYLPWHGFIDIDVNLFTGHDLYVKALYDYLSGTIQYYIYYDNVVLVNTIIAKMCMDIPITLQTKNDRDSAIFNNVSNTISGLIGAGIGVASGNPIGMTLGITQGVSALNNSNTSAPMRVMGNVGETGGYIAPQNCYLIIRRPTIQPSDGNGTSVTKNLSTWKHNIGMLCGYGYKLNQLTGFTTVHTPRITFTNTSPLQTEVDEIYDYLEKGVIL